MEDFSDGEQNLGSERLGLEETVVPVERLLCNDPSVLVGLLVEDAFNNDSKENDIFGWRESNFGVTGKGFEPSGTMFDSMKDLLTKASPTGKGRDLHGTTVDSLVGDEKELLMVGRKGLRLKSPKSSKESNSDNLDGLQPHSLLCGLWDAGVSSKESRNVEFARRQAVGADPSMVENYMKKVIDENSGNDNGEVHVRYPHKDGSGKLGYIDIVVRSKLEASRLAHKVESALMGRMGQL